MKTIYLVRHAKSSWDFPNLSDFERPLGERGERDAPKMGRRLAEMGIFADLMISSPAVRAVTTCETIASYLRYPIDKIEKDKALYHAGDQTLLRVIHDVNEHVRHLMLFGHNPGFTDFANALTNGRIENIPTSGVFACNFEVNHWSDAKLGEAKFLFFDFPKNKNSLPFH
jgi:phosphohistidine phosphatase